MVAAGAMPVAGVELVDPPGAGREAVAAAEPVARHCRRPMRSSAKESSVRELPKHGVAQPEPAAPALAAWAGCEAWEDSEALAAWEA